MTRPFPNSRMLSQRTIFHHTHLFDGNVAGLSRLDGLMSNFHRLIDEADGLASLGLYGDAWEVLESLPPAGRVLPALLAVRLMVCLGLPVPFANPPSRKQRGYRAQVPLAFSFAEPLAYK